MKYAYYPGCASESTARDQHESSLAIAKSLGLDFIEPDGWICCGTTPAHHTDKLLSLSLPAANLIKTQKMGFDMVVNCAACYNRMKIANYEIQNNSKIRQSVNTAIGENYDGSVNVKHIIEVLLKDLGLENLQKSLTHSLNGLKIASYYGCLLVRPKEATHFDDPENPTSMDRIVESLGGESIDFPHKVECCGGALTLTRPDIIIKLTDSILNMAQKAGAECIVVACPICQMNLDLRQKDIEKQTGKRYNMPVIYITQLTGLCLGIRPRQLGLNKLIVSPSAVLNKISLKNVKDF